ncbi:MAG: LPXTG cell wall anchor domain-containing protein [Ilumatobacteraceae bacterium]
MPATGGDNRVMPVVILLMCVGAGLVLVRRRHTFVD